MKNEESNFMEGLLGDLNSIEDGTSTGSVSQQYYDDTRNLLESLHEVGLEYGNLLNPEDAPVYKNSPVSESVYEFQDDYAAGEALASHYARIPGEYQFNAPEEEFYNPNPVPIQAPKPKTNWSLVENSIKGVKNASMYSVKSNHSGQILIDGIMMFEAAQTLVNLLNEGRTLSDFKVLGIISSGLQYTSVMNEVIQNSRKRQKVLTESKYDDAKELDKIISEKKKAAIQLRERVVTFLVEEGYITK